MKTIKSLLVVTLLLATLTIFAQGGPGGPGGPNGQGRPNGPGGPGGPRNGQKIENFMQDLNLTAAQKTKFNKMQEENAKQMKPTREALQQKFEEQRNITDKNSAKSKKLQAEIKTLMDKERDNREKFDKQFVSILTATQKAKYEKAKLNAQKEAKSQMKERYTSLAKELNFTKAQNTKLNKILSEDSNNFMETEKSFRALLTKEQAKKMQDLRPQQRGGENQGNGPRPPKY